MKNFKIFYSYQENNGAVYNAVQHNYTFHKSESAQQAFAEFKAALLGSSLRANFEINKVMPVGVHSFEPSFFPEPVESRFSNC